MPREPLRIHPRSRKENSRDVKAEKTELGSPRVEQDRKQAAVEAETVKAVSRKGNSNRSRRSSRKSC